MNNQRFFWLSLIIHVVALFLLNVIDQSSYIKKNFVAYGCHSRVMTHAYFRRMSAPKFNYNKYYPKRRRRVRRKSKKPALTKKKRTSTKRVSTKRVSTKRASTKRVEKASKKTVVRSKAGKNPIKKMVRKEVEPEKVEEFVEEEILHFNLMGEADPKMIMYQQCIQREVDRLWQPPLGVPKGTECVVTFEIDSNGKVKSFNMKQRSKILIYDLSIIKIGKKFEFDKCLWNKSFSINFLQ